MQIDKKTIQKLFGVAIGCIIVYWLLHETDRFTSLWKTISGILSPFVIGAALAFIMNVPMRAMERWVKFIRNPGLRRAIAILLTIIAIGLLIAGTVLLVIPQISATIDLLIPKLTAFIANTEVTLREFISENPQLMEWITENNLSLDKLNLSALIEKGMNVVSTSISTIATGAFTAVSSIAGAIVDAVFGLVFAVYCLFQKEILARQGRRLLYSLLPERVSDEIIRIARLTNSTFSNFISGQCLEAVILGAMFAVSMAIFKMPYIPLVSVLIAITALVPIVGAFVGCILGAFFILVNDPIQAFVFVAMFLVLQQIEGNVIYPKVVGTSIGLPGMWVLVALSIGGDLMGVAGMLIMIPLASVVYALVREFTNKRIAAREIPNEKLMDHPPELKSKFKEKREKRKEKRLLKQMKELAHKRTQKDNEQNKE